MPDQPADKFIDLLRKLVRVPKKEVDQLDREYQERESKTRVKSGEMIPKKTGT